MPWALEGGGWRSASPPRRARSPAEFLLLVAAVRAARRGARALRGVRAPRWISSVARRNEGPGCPYEQRSPPEPGPECPRISSSTALRLTLVSELISDPRLARERPAGRGRGGARSSAPHFGEPLGADGYFLRPALESLRMDLKCTGRARSRGGALAPLEAPRGPTPRAGRRLKGVGGWVFPPGDSLIGGRLGKGGSRGENQGGGREARPVLTVWPADLHHLPGWAGAERRSSRGRQYSRRGRRRRVDGLVAREEARSEEARSSAGSIGCHSAAAVTAEHGPTACHLHDLLHLVQAVGSCGADASTCITLLRALRSRALRAVRQRSASRPAAPLRSSRDAGCVAACTALSFSTVTRV